MFNGNQLGKRIIIADWHENQKLMMSIREAATIEEGSLQDRPFIEMAYFWGPDWAHYVADGKSPEALRPEQGDQHGRFYPAYRDAEALVTLTEVWPSNRRITQDGLNLLCKYGIPTRLEASHNE